MTDKEYEKQKKRIKKCLDDWAGVFDLYWYKLNIDYDRALNEDHPTWGGQTTTSWQYRQADITFYLPRCINATDEDLENMVVHELLHVVCGPMQQSLIDDSDHQMEFTVESLARCMLAARICGEQGFRKTKTSLQRS